MRDLIGCFVLCVVLISIGCYDAPAPGPPTPAPPAKPVSKGHRWGDPIDWVNDSPAVASVKFENLSFQDPKIKERLLRWENAAEKLRDDWFHHSWYKQRKVTDIQWWSSVPEHTVSQGHIEGGAENQPGEVHFVSIEYTRRQGTHPGFGLMRVDWMPKGNGWGVELHVSSDNSITFYARGIEEKRFDFYPGLKRWKHVATFGGVDYRLLAEAPVFKAEDAEDAKSLALKKLIEWSDSEEAFYEAGLSMLDDLERSVNAGIAIEMASKQVQEPRTGTSGGNPPRYFDKLSSRPLTAEEKESLRIKATDEIQRRRRVFEKHSVAMYAALKKAFPAEGF